MRSNQPDQEVKHSIPITRRSLSHASPTHPATPPTHGGNHYSEFCHHSLTCLLFIVPVNFLLKYNVHVEKYTTSSQTDQETRAQPSPQKPPPSRAPCSRKLPLPAGPLAGVTVLITSAALLLPGCVCSVSRVRSVSVVACGYGFVHSRCFVNSTV